MSPFKQFIFGAAQFQEREEYLKFQYKFLIVLNLAVIGAVGFFLGALLWVEQAPSPSRFVAPYSGTELVDAVMAMGLLAFLFHVYRAAPCRSTTGCRSPRSACVPWRPPTC